MITLTEDEISTVSGAGVCEGTTRLVGGVIGAGIGGAASGGLAAAGGFAAGVTIGGWVSNMVC